VDEWVGVLILIKMSLKRNHAKFLIHANRLAAWLNGYDADLWLAKFS